MGRTRQALRILLLRTPGVMLLSGAAMAPLSTCSDETAASFPEGQYIYSDAPRSASLDPAAGWTFEFADGRYAFSRDQIRVFDGAYSAMGDTLMLHDERGLPWAKCDEEATGSGVYTWRVADSRIVLDSVHDGCTRRKLQLTRAPLVTGHADPPDLVDVPDDIRGPWTAWFEFDGSADERVALLAPLITDDAELLGAVGREEVLSFAADFFCATGGRKPGSENYDRYGPCDQDDVLERTEVRPFSFDRTQDRIREHGVYVMRRTTEDGRTDVGVERYEVIWVREPGGAWKIERMGQ